MLIETVLIRRPQIWLSDTWVTRKYDDITWDLGWTLFDSVFVIPLEFIEKPFSKRLFLRCCQIEEGRITNLPKAAIPKQTQQYSGTWFWRLLKHGLIAQRTLIPCCPLIISLAILCHVAVGSAVSFITSFGFVSPWKVWWYALGYIATLLESPDDMTPLW